MTRTIRIHRVRRAVLASPPVVPCAACGKDVRGVTFVEALALLQSPTPSLGDLLANGRVHAIPTAAGATWICRDSLFPSAP